MTTNTDVKYFHSSMSGAPALSGTAGTLIGVLNACLTDGFGSVTVNPLGVAANVATATVSTGHGFVMTGAIGPVIQIAGATPAGLNGQWRIQSIPSATQFTFATAGISDQAATGTITAKRAPAGFSKVFSDANKAAYQADDIQSTRLFLRVDDSPAQFPTLTMYETMSDVNTGTGASTTRYLAKSDAASSAARTWRLIADGRMFYLFINSNAGGTWPSVMAFGDILPYRSGDTYHCLLIGHAAADAVSHLYYADGNQTGSELARTYSQLGGKVSSGRYSHRGCQYLGVGLLNTPNWADNAYHVWPIQVCESSGVIARGEMPGLFCPIHNALIANGTILTQGDRQLLVQQTASAGYQAALNLTGPWR